MRSLITKDKNKIYQKRGKEVMILFFVAFFVLACRLAWVQIYKRSEFLERVEKMRVKSLDIQPKRGSIVDRNGKVLARDTQLESLYVYLEQVKDVKQTAIALSGYLNISSDVIYNELISSKSKYVPILKNVPPESLGGLKGFTIEGISIEDTVKREYPNGTLACHLIGYLDSEGKPIQGAEKAFYAEMKGTPGKLVAELDRSGRVIPETRRQQIPVLDGPNVMLTIDFAIQEQTEKALAEACEKYTPRAATAIVLDPATGEILAMASFPSYDLNKRGEELAKKPYAEINRSIASSYEPGSIMKPITIAAAWEENIINANSIVNCSGSAQFGKRTIRCAHSEKHGAITPETVIEKSCNVGTAQIGLKLGSDKMYDYIQRFGMLDKQDIGLPGELKGNLSNPSTWYDKQHRLANVSFGQGVAVTPIGIASAYCVLANNGIWTQPHILKQIGNTPVPQPVTRQVVSAETARAVRQMMLKVVDSGTGKSAAVNGHSIAGKTGTAQKYDPATKKMSSTLYLASFAGMFPVDNPRAVILVMLDEPQGASYGGTVAAPVFQQIASFLCRYWRLPTDRPVINQTTSSTTSAQKTDSAAKATVKPTQKPIDKKAVKPTNQNQNNKKKPKTTSVPPNGKPKIGKA